MKLTIAERWNLINQYRILELLDNEEENREHHRERRRALERGLHHGRPDRPHGSVRQPGEIVYLDVTRVDPGPGDPAGSGRIRYSIVLGAGDANPWLLDRVAELDFGQEKVFTYTGGPDEQLTSGKYLVRLLGAQTLDGFIGD